MGWDLTRLEHRLTHTICNELVDAQWTITDDGRHGIPDPNEEFPSMMIEAFRKVMNTREVRRMRIALLRAELQELEALEEQAV